MAGAYSYVIDFKANVDSFNKKLAGVDDLFNDGTKAAEDFNDVVSSENAKVFDSIEDGNAAAKRQASTFGKDLKAGVTDAKSAFGDLLRGDITALPDLFKASSTAAGAFSNGLSGVKVALISTGIGALIVALGLAIGGLVQYFKGTEEGQIAFMRVMNNIKAYTQPVIQMFGRFGKAIFELFSGEWKNAWETAKGAVSGVGDAINQNKSNLDALNDAQQRFIVTNDDLMAKSARLQADIEDLRERAADEANYSAQERLKLMNEAIAKQKEVFRLQREITGNELEFKKLKAAQGDADIATNDELEDLANKMIDLEGQESRLLKKIGGQREGIVKQAQLELQAHEKSVALAAQMAKEMSTTVQSKVVTSVTGTVAPPDVNTMGLEGMGKVLDNLKSKTDSFNESYKASVDIAAIAAPAMGDAFASIGEGIGNMLSGTADAGDIFKNLMGIVASFMGALGKALITSGLAGIAFQKLIANPFLAVGAGIALLAASAVVGNLLTAGPGGGDAVAMANGGILYGPTNVLAGEYPGAGSNPEVIAPLSKLRDMLGDRSNGVQQVQVQVVGQISGNNLRLAQKRTERYNDQFNG